VQLNGGSRLVFLCVTSTTAGLSSIVSTASGPDESADTRDTAAWICDRVDTICRVLKVSLECVLMKHRDVLILKFIKTVVSGPVGML